MDPPTAKYNQNPPSRPRPEILQIPCEELKTEERYIAKGAFGKVYKGTWGETNVACKRLKDTLDGGSRREFEKEVATLNKLNSPHIVRLLGISTLRGLPAIVMEYCEGGRL
eukprot:TRINITY_DN7182_c0_g1_i1.p1 TRINITY_DN7182_c0_g1~~TRINITY_DN7182_c0_g1_i1.p1  ORF type:complete len:111 (+),score=24.27 TRINITY_DN7182_c0_g1_i1:148-480(+)